MRALREWWCRLRNTVRPGRTDADLEEELRAHLELAAEDERRRRGSADAARAAIVRHGAVAPSLEVVRDQRGVRWLHDLARDLQYGLRGARRNPVFASAAVATLALAIGLSTAIFSVVEAVVFRELPIRDPGAVYFVAHGSEDQPGLGSNYPYFERIRALTGVFAGVAAGARATFKVRIGDDLEVVHGQFTSGNYHAVLGVPIVLGRGFPSDDRPAGDAAHAAVISDGYWTRRFARDPAVLGRTIAVDGVPVAIVGVTAPGFVGMESGAQADVTLPLAFRELANPGFLTMHDTWTSMSIVGRLKPGIGRGDAASAVETVFQQYVSEPENAWLRSGPRSERFRRSLLLPAGRGTSGLRDRYAEALRVLAAMVGLVLLIACANVANLLLARGAARAKEMALRLSLGASRGRLVRQLVTESVLLSALGGGAGLGLAWAGTRAIAAIVGVGPDPVHVDVQPNATVLAFTAGVSIGTGILVGLAPAIRSTRVDLTPALRTTGPRSGRRGRWSARHGLMTVQIGLCVALLAGAGLLTRSLQNLRAHDGGFDRDHVLMFSLDALGTSFAAAQMPQLCADLVERFRHRIGVTAGSCSTSVPVHPRGNARPLEVPGAPARDVDARLVFMNRVTPGYFQALGIGLARGRAFDERDAASSPRVAIVSRATARDFFGDEDPLGRRVHFFRDEGNPLTIVGVVEDAAQYSLRQEPLRTIYTPLAQVAEPEPFVTVSLRARGDLLPLAASIRPEVRAVNPAVVVDYIRTMEQQIDVTLVRERLLALLSSAFGLLALCVACVGLYGVVSYDVTRRMRELGIRAALGATRADLLGRTLRGALATAIVGVVAGLALAGGAARWLSDFLFGVVPGDPLTFVSVGATIVGTSLVASYLPARRAARLDPAAVLRAE